MKKILALVLALALVLCSVSALAEGVNLGLGVATSLKCKDASADADGSVQVNSAIVAVVVDDNGVILSVQIDAAQTTGAFSAAGAVTTDVTAVIKSKMEKQEEYNMRGASPIGREWFEQVTDLEAWMVGKTVEEVKAAYEGADETLKAVCTITLDDTIVALEKAVADALAK